jgi:formate--tetrahydrofolate ligase
VFPRCVVLVATLRALAAHGGGEGANDLAAIERGLAHLDRQIANVRAFGLSPVVAINEFGTDSEEGLARVSAHCAAAGVRCGRSTAFAHGGEGAMDLARAVAEVADASDASPPPRKHLYELDAPIHEKLRAVARTIYGARDVLLDDAAAAAIARFEKAGYARLPVCIAKTHLSLTDDPEGGGLATGFDVRVREARLSAGAGFVVALMGEIMTMPGLPKEPAAARVRIEPDGRVLGLMQGE